MAVGPEQETELGAAATAGGSLTSEGSGSQAMGMWGAEAVVNPALLPPRTLAAATSGCEVQPTQEAQESGRGADGAGGGLPAWKVRLMAARKRRGLPP